MAAGHSWWVRPVRRCVKVQCRQCAQGKNEAGANVN